MGTLDDRTLLGVEAVANNDNAEHQMAGVLWPDTEESSPEGRRAYCDVVGDTPAVRCFILETRNAETT